MKFRCTKCNYQFEKDKFPLRCPYCGKNDSVVKEKSAQDIIDEAV